MGRQVRGTDLVVLAIAAAGVAGLHLLAVNNYGIFRDELYGEAGALEYYARRLPLPPVISPHNNYWFWGPGPDGGTLIIIGGSREDNARVFERLDKVGRTRCGYCMPYENDRPIWIGRGWKIPLSRLWPGERLFI